MTHRRHPRTASAHARRAWPVGLLALLLVTSLTACGDDDASEGAKTVASGPTVPARSDPDAEPPPSAPGPTASVTLAPATTPETAPATATSTTGSPTGDLAPARQAALDALVAAGVPGVVAASRDQAARQIGASGLADLAVGTPMTTDTALRTGSIAKTFVATVALQLDVEGVLSLDDTVERWLPGLVPGGDTITIRQLLGNRSGLFDFAEDPRVLAPYLSGEIDHLWTAEQLVAISNEHAPNFPVGTATRYSNTDYTLVGMIIETATARTVAEEVQTRIVEPLGLTRTSIPATSELPEPYAHGYLVDVDRADITTISPSLSSHGGNLVSTAGDLATFFDALFDGELLPPDALAEMQATTTAAEGEVLGLGLQVIDLPCGTFIGHSGSTPGYKAAAFNDLEHDRQFVILVNSLTLDDQVGSSAANAAFDAAAAAIACP